MNIDDVLINCLQFLYVEDIVKCSQVDKRWNQISTYLLNTIKKDCYFLKWRNVHNQMIRNSNSTIETSKRKGTFYYLEEEGVVEHIDEHFDHQLNTDVCSVEFISAFGASVKFELCSSDNLSPQQTYPHYLKKSRRIVYHIGFHDEGSHEIEYHYDVVFDISDWGNIRKSVHKIPSSLPNINGRCQMCSRWNTGDDILPVGTIHLTGAYDANYFITPWILKNTPALLRTMARDNYMLLIFENGACVKKFPIKWKYRASPVDSDKVFIQKQIIKYISEPLKAKIINVTNDATQNVDIFHLGEDFVFTNNVTLFGNNGNWRLVQFENDKWNLGPVLAPGGSRPVYCPHEKRLLFLQHP